MIKRSDLAKQFELVVQQEIINHNRAIEANNLVVNQMGDKINTVQTELESRIVTDHDKLTNVSLEITRLMEEIAEIKCSLEKLSDSGVKSNNRSNQVTINIQEAINNLVAHSLSLNSSIDSLRDEFKVLNKELNILRNEHEAEKEKTKQILSQGLNKLYADILSLPSESKQIKKELLEDIHKQRIDKDTITKEIAILKKCFYVTEKDVENIYTMIKRINNKLDK